MYICYNNNYRTSGHEFEKGRMRGVEEWRRKKKMM